MKCPNCHKEVEKGSLYCPHCLSEIPWVREFDSVETQLRKKEQQDSGEESDREGLSAGMFIYNRKRIIVVCLAAAVLLGAFCYRQLHTFSALYSHASQQFEQEHYGAAARSIEAALEKKPNNESANILLAKCLEKQGKLKEGILILKPLVKNADAGVGVYEELVSLLAKNGRLWGIYVQSPGFQHCSGNLYFTSETGAFWRLPEDLLYSGRYRSYFGKFCIYGAR